MRRIPTVITLFTAALAACSTDSPLPTSHMSHPGSVSLSDLEHSADAQALASLKQLTAKFHDLDVATNAEYVLFSNQLTAPDGCISDAKAGGMGYHYGRLNNLGDDAVELLDPEFLVYAPKDGPQVDGTPRTRLAALTTSFCIARSGRGRTIRRSNARPRSVTSRRRKLSATSRSHRRASAAG